MDLRANERLGYGGVPLASDLLGKRQGVSIYGGAMTISNYDTTR